VLVVDDFTTEGYGFETARNFLLNAGAKKVICVAIGKYLKPHKIFSPVLGTTWDSFDESHLTLEDFETTSIEPQIDEKALENF
jgi:phosphoribosylpyrophosphate synthetase